MKRELRDTLYTLPALLSLAHVFPQFATTFATLTEEQEQLVNDLFNRITFQPTERKDAFKFTTHGERWNYSPLQSLLDCILAAQPQSHQAHCPIRIIIYDKQMADSVENEAPIKPDLLGCKPSILGEVTGKDPRRIKWSEVELVLEVKDSWPEMLAQTAVYARAMLNEGSRWFAPALMFNHHSKSIRFGFPSRVGLYTTTELFLTQQADLEILVRALWSFQSSRASDVGIDPFAPIFNSKLHFFLPCGTNGSCSWWSVEAVITRRACVRGRAPHTFQVVRVLTSEEVLANQIANLGISSAEQAEPVLRRSARLAQLQPPPQAPDIISSLSAALVSQGGALNSINRADIPPTAMIPDVAIVSDSFPYREFAATEFFNALRGQHGIPDLIYGFTVPHPLNRFTSQNRNELRHSKEFGYSPPPDQPLLVEERVHRRLLFATAGKSLLANEVTLLDTIHVAVDTMIALSNAYFLGFLQREPSITNILIRETPEKRTPEMIKSNACLRRSSSKADFTFLEKHLQRCKGMIINADLAVRHDSSRAVARRLSTVLPFASRRQLDAWMETKPGSPGPPHTLLDDIEGVLWVVMWKIVTHADRESREMGWHKALSSDDIDTVNTKKHAIVNWFNDRGHMKKVEKQVGIMARPVIFWGTIYDIMKEWMTIAKQARLDVEVFESDNDEYPDEVIKALTLEHLTMYLKAGVEFLEKSGQYRDGAE